LIRRTGRRTTNRASRQILRKVRPVTIYLTKFNDLVVLMARAEDDESIGDLIVEVKPGESAFGRSYAAWAALPGGPHEVTGLDTTPETDRFAD
jgi:hypothetical protein